MKYRPIKALLPAQPVNMGGHKLDQPIPTQKIDQIDPFLLIHHWVNKMPGDQRQQDVGVGPHPHRGFSPVTFVFQGDVHHRDSMGEDAVVSAGGTQWMHAGKGVTHSERPSGDLAGKGGTFEIIQFWVNTPSKHKMEQPYYLALQSEDTPTIQDDGVSIGVVAGNYQGVVGPAKTYSPQVLLRGTLAAEGTHTFELPADHNVLVYVLDGKVSLSDGIVNDKELAWIAPGDGPIPMRAHSDTRFIVLAGQPIGEKVSSYGPFVMNNQTEIMQAIRDAQMGKMGVLIEDFT